MVNIRKKLKILMSKDSGIRSWGEIIDDSPIKNLDDANNAINRLRKKVKSLEEMTKLKTEVDNLKKEIDNQSDTIKSQSKTIGELTKSTNINSKVIQANIKSLDHLVRRGNEEDIRVLSELIAQPEKINPLSLLHLSLVHVKDDLFRVKLFDEVQRRLRPARRQSLEQDIEKCGVILSLEKLVEESNHYVFKLENNCDDMLKSKVEFRLAVTRLVYGIDQLVEAWKNGKLLNEPARETLDQHAINDVKKSLSEGSGSPTLKNMFNQKLEQFQTKNVKGYLEKKLFQNDMKNIDELVLTNIEKWVFNSASEKVQDVLSNKIKENMMGILLRMFKNNEFTENVQSIFNLESVIAKLIAIPEGELKTKFTEIIYNEIIIIINENPEGEQKIKLMTQYKDDAIKNIIQKWNSNNPKVKATRDNVINLIQDGQNNKVLDKMVGKILMDQLRSEQTGDFHTEIIREGIKSLLEQFKEGKALRSYVYGVLEDKIKTWIAYRKPQENQKEFLIKGILGDLKKSTNPDDKLILADSLKSHGLMVNLAKIHEIWW